MADERDNKFKWPLASFNGSPTCLERCAAAFDGAIAYSDIHHLTNAGAQRVLDRYRDDFAWVFGAQRREPN